MTNFNPMQLIKSGLNPEQIVISMLREKMGNTPFGANLISMAQNHDTKGLETVARNMCAAQGVDYDKEIASFKQKLGIK